MILFSITYNVEQEIHQEFLTWMKTFFIVKMKETGLIEDYKILRLLTEIEGQGITYSFQFYLKSMQSYLKYENYHAYDIQGEILKRFNDKCVSFSTILDVLE